MAACKASLPPQCPDAKNFGLLKLPWLPLPPEIISYAIWLYRRFCLSFRDGEELLANRGVTVSYEAVRQLHGIAAIGLHSITRFLGNLRGGHDPALEILLREIPIQPVPTRPRFVGQGQPLALGLQLPTQFVDSTLPGPNRAEGDTFGLPVLGHIRHCNRLLMDSQTDEKCATLCHG